MKTRRSRMPSPACRRRSPRLVRGDFVDLDVPVTVPKRKTKRKQQLQSAIGDEDFVDLDVPVTVPKRKQLQSAIGDDDDELFKWVVPSLSELMDQHSLRSLRDSLRLSHLHYVRSNLRRHHPYSPPGHILGPIPHFHVGFQFFSRAHMVSVGMHARWLSPVDYISKPKPKPKTPPLDYAYSFPLAVAIVLSPQSQDHHLDDDSEDILFSDSPRQLQLQDQLMTAANLALKHSMKHSTPVRIIRGHKCGNSYTEKVYTYDGLFQVVDYWAEKGLAGFNVFKFRLKRLQGQPNLVPQEVSFVRGPGSSARSKIPGLVCKDISNGREVIPIPVTNLVDDPPVAPEGFSYITSIEVASNVKIPSNARGCKCKEKCTDPETCACAKLNSSDFPYVIQNGGRLIEPKDVVFECGPNCGCGSDCVNRTSQRGLKYRLEVYRTLDKGWGVRSWDYIPSGAPVCEYIGILRKSDDLDNATGNEFIFEIDCLQTINGIGVRERRFGDVTLRSNAVKKSRKLSVSPEFCLDAGTKGNLARFINHSCEPNLFVQCILSSHHDLTLARIVLFAADNIVPLQELTYDYGYELDSVVGSDGKIKKLACCCGATCCRRRLY